MAPGSGKINISDQPLVYIIAPLIVILGAGALCIILLHRHRRRRSGMAVHERWPPENMRDHMGNDMHVHYFQRRPVFGLRQVPYRWSSEDRSEEGLNELGEAPPPYQPKKEEEDGGSGGATTDGAVVTGDGSTDTILPMEEGRPPAYPAEPRPAVIMTDGSREMYR